jgi:hypothetical protein
MKLKDAEVMRIKYLYRALLLKGKINLPLESAQKLVGPDCAYHLYAVRNPSSVKASNKRCSRVNISVSSVCSVREFKNPA